MKPMYSFLLHAGFLVCFCATMVGCSRKVAPSISTEVKDSVYIKEVPRFITVPIAGDKVTATMKIECDGLTPTLSGREGSVGVITKKMGRASVTVSLKPNGELTAVGVCDSLQKVIEARDREISRFKQSKRTEIVVKTEYKTRQIDIVCRWISASVVLIILGYAALTYLKKTYLP